MGSFVTSAGKVLLVAYFLFLHVLIIYFVIDKLNPQSQQPDVIIQSPPTTETSVAPTERPQAAPSILYNANANQSRSDTAPPGHDVAISDLAIPVDGVDREKLYDSFSDARSEGRVHDAIDIPAPEGTAVIAAADGEIARLFDSERGGLTIYQWDSAKKYVFYYAHLRGHSPGLAPGTPVKKGQRLGSVGDTGNAGPGNFHLHFAIWAVKDPRRFWEGENINPFPILKGWQHLAGQ